MGKSGEMFVRLEKKYLTLLPHQKRPMRRKDFLDAKNGLVVHLPMFVLQIRKRNDEHKRQNPLQAALPRVGFTVTKRIGNAVERNRIRRRLREAVRLCSTDHIFMGADHVLIARRSALNCPFESICKALDQGLFRVRRLSNDQK